MNCQGVEIYRNETAEGKKVSSEWRVFFPKMNFVTCRDLDTILHRIQN